MASQVHFQNLNVSYQLPSKRAVKQWINSVIEKEGLSTGEISIVFCDDEYLLQVNRDFLQHDYYTDIITFQNTDIQGVSGDLIISIDRVKDNAQTLGYSFLDELHRVIVHGVLHLCGYKDKTSSQVKIMRAKEDEYLKKRLF